jgi:hypothetical protein
VQSLDGVCTMAMVSRSIAVSNRCPQLNEKQEP